VVEWFGAVQSQEYAVARWSIGLRARRLRDSDVERAYAHGEILRTHVLRPTWHFVSPSDIRWLIELTAPRIRAQMTGRHRQLELDGRLIARSSAVICKVLEDGEHLTRAEIQKQLEGSGIDLKNERLGHIMMLLELDTLVCSGVPKGRQHTYALLAERAQDATSMERDAALAELARRYFRSHGPATDRELARWATLTLADVRRAIEMLGGEIESLEADGHRMYTIGAAPRRSPTSPRCMLLQIYDEYVGGYGETRSIVDPHARTHTSPAVRLPFMHVAIFDGVVIGHWRPSRTKGGGVVDLQLAAGLSREVRREVDAAIAAYEAFVRS